MTKKMHEKKKNNYKKILEKGEVKFWNLKKKITF